MRGDKVSLKPLYVLTIDGDVVEDAGINGLITRYDVADNLRVSLAAQYPERDVALFGCFMVKR